MTTAMKKQACKALGNENLFTDSVVKQYLGNNKRSAKKDWLEKVQKSGQAAHYATAQFYDVSRRRFKSFKELSLLQLENMLTQVEDPSVLRYLEGVRALVDGSLIRDRAKMQDMVNRMECKVVRYCAEEDTRPDKKDMRIFLFAAVLFADRDNRYEQTTKDAFYVLCDLVR